MDTVYLKMFRRKSSAFLDKDVSKYIISVRKLVKFIIFIYKKSMKKAEKV